MMTDQNKIKNRGDCFKLFAACFYEPDKNLFIEERVCNNLSDLLNDWASGAAKAAGEMGLHLESLSQQQLSIDHAALFIGPFELIAAPYGSIYTGNHRQVMGETTIDTLRFYEDAGLSIDVKEPPDHIAIELEFMSYLCNKEAESSSTGSYGETERYRDMQVQFFRTTLQWVPQFCEAIEKGADNQFYRSLAECLSRFMVSCRQVYDKTATTSA
jgi:TorA maturation chaperone TorD